MSRYTFEFHCYPLGKQEDGSTVTTMWVADCFDSIRDPQGILWKTSWFLNGDGNWRLMDSVFHGNAKLAYREITDSWNAYVATMVMRVDDGD